MIRMQRAERETTIAAVPIITMIATRKIGRNLRHTGLTLAAATGATTAELMHRAGHASASASLRYQHATRDRDQVLANALAELVQTSTVTEWRCTNAANDSFRQ